MKKSGNTKFASVERTSLNVIEQKKETLLGNDLLITALDSSPNIILILDENRQIVYANKRFSDFLSDPIERLLGKRPGEAFGCVHCAEEPGGCGTSLFCQYCGAVKSILSAQNGEQNIEECRMTVHGKERDVSYDLRVFSVPVTINNKSFVIFTILDIADEKRREVLQRTFFHDVLNDATILALHLYNLIEGNEPKTKKSMETLNNIANMIVATIQEQRDLLMAEMGELIVSLRIVDVRSFLEKLVAMYKSTGIGGERGLVLDQTLTDKNIATDKTLLNRVIGNLIKNALEASRNEEAGMVSVGFTPKEGKVVFHVHNPEVMPLDIQHQVFKRSFTTKGSGRGVGTYSVKFFTENYLKGKVWFESKEGKGTTFFVEIPEKMSQKRVEHKL